MSTPSPLFDAPGPRARRRHAVLTALGAVVAAVLVALALRRMAEAQQLQASLWSPFLTAVVWREYLLPGLRGTLQAAALSVALAGVFGILFGAGRLSPNRSLRWTCGAVVEFFRAVPVLIMMIFAFTVFAQRQVFPNELNPLAAVVAGLTLYNGSVIAELVRSGVVNLPRGQTEAALSIGLTRRQALRSVQLPQAVTAMLPALISQLVVVLKDSALGYGITYGELLNWSKTLGSAYANTVPAYLVAALLFIMVNVWLGRGATAVERWLGRRRGAVSQPVDDGAPALPAAGPTR
ncbi:MAG TPA: amino acid ABC transporter permease [Kineosporiaceae bacterium]